MTARLPRRLRWLSALVGIVLLASAPATTRDIRVDCEAWVWFENDQRKIFTTPYIDAECGWFHDAPYGNWGVNSDFGSREDGNQFMGWNQHGSQWQWNSCTVDYRPDNEPGTWNAWSPELGTHQATVWGAQWHATWYLGIFEGTSCADFGGIGQYNGNHMALYELDPWWPDQHVDTLYFPPLSVDASGCDEYGCVVAGEFEDSNGAQYGSTTARARMKLFLQRIETEVCEESCPLNFPLRPPIPGAVLLPDIGRGFQPSLRKQAASRSADAPVEIVPNRSIRHRAQRDGTLVGDHYMVPLGHGGYAKIRKPTKR